MAVIVPTSASFPVYSQSSNPGTKAAKFGGGAAYLGGFMFQPASGGLQVKANAQAPLKMNGIAENLRKDKEVKNEDDKTYINQLPKWSTLLATIMATFFAAEKQKTMIDMKPRQPSMVADPFGLGIIIQDNIVSRLNFSIRSYEIGADRAASIETLMNHLQETIVNHFKNIGLLGVGFGSSPEMCKRNLIWVVTRMQVLVDRYPTWNDDVQVFTWISSHEKNNFSGNWLVRDCKTGETLIRAASVWVLMDKMTRKLSKIPEEVREDLDPYFFNSATGLNKDRTKLPKLDVNTANCVHNGITPRWSDLDLNQHVNNVKYVGWLLETTPSPILDTHELSSLTLEYRRECGRDSVLQSLTAVSSTESDNLVDSGNIQCHHLLRLEDGADIVRGRTEWRPKHANNFQTE